MVLHLLVEAQADSQIFGSSISGGSNDYSISGVATGCKSVGSNGTCSVQITYTGAGTRAGNVGLSPTTGYASTTAASCTPASATENQCTFNITNNGSAAQSLIITLGGTATTSMFTFGQ